MFPAPLQRRIEATAGHFLNPGISRIDFSKPSGEPALTAPDSVSWRVFKNPLALFVGGITAVILELAEPRIRTGVWNHTTFRNDPLRRIQRTGYAAMVTVYGPRSEAEAMISQVCRLHARISGMTPDGQAYRADDPDLLTWVHATASFGFLEAYNAYVHRLTPVECDRFYAEGMLSALLYGSKDAPTSRLAMAALFEKMADALEPSSILHEFLDIMRRAPVLPSPLDRMQGMLVKAAIELVPASLRMRLELMERESLRPWQRHAVRQLGILSDRILLRSTPAVQACRRMGLPNDYLYARGQMASHAKPS